MGFQPSSGGRKGGKTALTEPIRIFIMTNRSPKSGATFATGSFLPWHDERGHRWTIREPDPCLSCRSPTPMNMTKSLNFLTSRAAIAVCVLVSAGCDVEPETFESLRGAVRRVSQTGQDLSPTSNDTSAAAAEESVSFTAPYPDRANPFAFPGTEQEQAEDARAISSVGDIEVLGFANVDEPRVFLRTRRMTKSLAVGDVIEGIEVLRISPPTVELRTGELSWNATMFESGRLRGG